MNECLSCGATVKNKFCNTSCQNKYYNPLRVKERIEIILSCECCGKEFSQRIKKDGKNNIKKNCSLYCANKRNHSAETKKQISDTLKEDYLEPRITNCKNCNELITYYTKHAPRYCSTECKIKSKPFFRKICPNCNKHFITTNKELKYCCKHCGYSNAGKKSANFQNRRSKNEKYFAELCESYFSNVLTNVPLFNGWDADVIVEDYKIAILWNGKWHYEKINKKHSLLQVQTRDKIKINEIENAGYISYIIKDMGRFNPIFVCEQFEIFLKYTEKLSER